MPNRSTSSPDDRRRQPRVSCRLHGRITHGREKIRARIVDISEGGLCLLSPVWLNPKQPLAIAIEVPGRETATVHVEIWHVRREKSRSTNGKIWVAGAVLRDADAAYAQLLAAAGLAGAATTRSTDVSKPMPATSPTARPVDPSVAPSASTSPSASNARPASANASARAPRRASNGADETDSGSGARATDAPVAEAIDDLEPRIFRLRCKAKGSPRTRVLSLAAESVEEAHKLAQHDLGGDWDILDVLET